MATPCWQSCVGRTIDYPASGLLVYALHVLLWKMQWVLKTGVIARAWILCQGNQGQITLMINACCYTDIPKIAFSKLFIEHRVHNRPDEHTTQYRAHDKVSIDHNGTQCSADGPALPSIVNHKNRCNDQILHNLAQWLCKLVDILSDSLIPITIT